MIAFSRLTRFSFVRAADNVHAGLERHFRRWGALLLVFLFACAIARDLRKPMWVDELYTTYMARQASAVEIVKATLEGCDGAPPLYAIVVHLVRRGISSEALAARLVSTLGYCGMVLGLLAFGRRRLPAVYAWIGALFAANAAFVYASEGRPYGVVLGCAAAALCCWQAAAEGRRRALSIPLLALSLASMTAMHYYSVFFLLPLSLAELMRWRNRGKPDIAMFGAGVPALLVLALHYPLIQAAKVFQAHYWSPAMWSQAFDFYESHRLVLTMVCMLSLVAIAMFSKIPDRPTAKWQGLTQPEWVVVCALSFMPIFVLALSIYTTHAFVDRYAIWAITGLGLLAAAVICEAGRANTAAGLTVLTALLALLIAHEATGWKPVLFEGEGVRRALLKLPESDEPIVVGDHAVFIELSYYLEPKLNRRLVYPLERELDLRYLGFDTGAILTSALRHRSRLRIIPYEEVVAAYPRFVLAATHKDYLPRHLAASGYRVTPISGAAPTLFEVTAPGFQNPSRIQGLEPPL
jgi:hypothetical protein